MLVSNVSRRVRVDHNLNRQSGMWHLSLYYRRTRRLDVPLITELRILPEDEKPTTMSEHWTRTTLSVRDGVRGLSPAYLWYRTGQTLRAQTAKGPKEELITELDVLYGEDRAWYGFEKLEPPVKEEKGRIDAVWITYRKGVKRKRDLI